MRDEGEGEGGEGEGTHTHTGGREMTCVGRSDDAGQTCRDIDSTAVKLVPLQLHWSSPLSRSLVEIKRVRGAIERMKHK